METIKILPNQTNKKVLDKISEIIKRGGVVVSPTDTVYGLLADAGNKKAVEKLYKIKARPKSKPLPVFVKDLKTAEKIAFINETQKKILIRKWPGKYTFVLKRKKGLKIFGADKRTIALRLPKYKFLNSLLKTANKPLVQSSANISQEPASGNIKKILKSFKDKKNQPDLIIDAGNLIKNKPSTIIDIAGGSIEIIRK